MQRYCERCERVTQDGNLWCQDIDCPAEQGYPLLSYGEYLGDIKVTKLMRVWRTAAMYQAERDKEPVLLKVAHPTEDSSERLRREAVALEALTPRQTGLGAFIRSFFPSSRSLYPVPLPAVPSRSGRPYGEITFRGDPRVFSVYKHAEGKILSDLLLENPQIWHTQGAWLITTVAQALRPLVRSEKLHLCISPDIILVDTDKAGNLRPVLLDLGLLMDDAELSSIPDWLKLCEPAYSAPEVLANSRNGALTLAADAYSLGMIYYEILAGRPAYEAKLRRDGQLREDVTENRKPVPVGRPELESSGVATIVERAVSPTDRYGNVLELSSALTEIYSSPPRERRSIPRRTYLLLGVVALALIAVGIFAGVTLIQVLSG